MALSASIDKVIELARRLRDVRNDRRLEKKSGLTRMSDISTLPPSQEEIELRAFLIGLSPAEIYMTIAIMYLGRGDFDTSSGMLAEYAQMSDTFSDPRLAAEQMIGKTTLVAHLEAGLKILHNEKVDGLLS